MKTNIEYHELMECPLFAGIGQADLDALLGCLSAKESAVPQGGFLLRAGDPAARVGVLLSGAANVVQEDFWGNRHILARLEPGDLFGEAFAFAGIESVPVSVTAEEDSRALFIDCGRIAAPCGNACAFHESLIRNMMRILAGKNVALTRKIEHVVKRTTRLKLLSFFSAEAQRAGSNTFAIAFDRQALADYLAVERSAMSAELGRMQREGLIQYKKNRFTLHARS